jgi:hypothetical protein
MVEINLNYSGLVNGENIQGNGVLQSNSETGLLTGTVVFTEFPNSFSPYPVENSLLSIICGNSAKEQLGAKNIHHITNGHYTSIREVEFTTVDGSFLGNIIINGICDRVSENVFNANVVISGSYTGSLEIEKPTGYVLPLQPVNEYELEGSFDDSVELIEGGSIMAHHQHRYFFNNGVSFPLENVKIDLNFIADETFWNADEKTLQLTGMSTVQPL